MDKLKQLNQKPKVIEKPTENLRLQKFSIDNTFIVQDATSQAVNSLQSPEIAELRKSAGSGNKDLPSLVAKAELTILEKEIEKSVISTIDQSEVHKSYIDRINNRIVGAKPNENQTILQAHNRLKRLDN